MFQENLECQCPNTKLKLEYKCLSVIGIPLPFSQVVTQCDCGASLDEYGYHLLTCKYGGGPVWQHNIIVSTWAKCLDELSIPHQIEPRNRYADSENRPDIVVCDLDGHTYHH